MNLWFQCHSINWCARYAMNESVLLHPIILLFTVDDFDTRQQKYNLQHLNTFFSPKFKTHIYTDWIFSLNEIKTGPLRDVCHLTVYNLRISSIEICTHKIVNETTHTCWCYKKSLLIEMCNHSNINEATNRNPNYICFFVYPSNQFSKWAHIHLLDQRIIGPSFIITQFTSRYILLEIFDPLQK